MPRIRCHYLDCVFLDDGFCSAAAVELDPDTGCLTYAQSALMLDEEGWDDEDDLDETWDEMGFEEDEDDLWLDEEDDF